ncbi:MULTISPECIES: DoxX family protein [Pedobacter]|uniref:DoxX family protein n=1 Tax=Pedobacter heparinus (strain ATCC 13125 / DSM 2366 / CIP 104194 / JCM 7457 / NBRC 12017 / NCIMB 9290 / NRRL B-14731 / HIM 762-3) TaxID=485917 RepID=C6XT29_PEDHD|nr:MULTISPECIES: DoxX family protein [Pedobacter]ACU03590.1 DoxX family protein [Pedobacter heparinus DSM 2366]MBB5436898.1 putative oxidoreductase [Pedobacter sp. AK017]
MKRLFNTNFNNESVHFMLLVLRVAAGAFMLVHGYQKLGWITAGGEIQFGDPIGVGPVLSLYLAVFAEFFCSILLILGLATRFALIPLIVTMVVAVGIVHAADGFDKKELGLHYLVVYLFLLVAGAGKYSIDNLISRNLSGRRR